MRLSLERIRQHCSQRGLSISQLLVEAGVSRTAFYSLLRRASVVPESVSAIAATLGRTELDLLETGTPADAQARGRLRRARKICRADSSLAFENVWHTLIMIQRCPRERLEGSLRRGRGIALQR
jgi:hypothetical protein